MRGLFFLKYLALIGFLSDWETVFNLLDYSFMEYAGMFYSVEELFSRRYEIERFVGGADPTNLFVGLRGVVIRLQSARFDLSEK